MKRRLALIALTGLLLSGCDNFVCGNKIAYESTSPDGLLIASVFERNCGATSPYVEVVSIRFAKAPFLPSDDKGWVFTIHGKSNVTLEWNAAESLAISYTYTGDTPTKVSRWQNVAITFHTT